MFKKMTAAAACFVLASVVMAAGAIAAGHQGKNVVRGHTSQGRKIVAKVLRDKVDVKGFSIKLRCQGGYVLIDQESGFLPSAVSHKGMIHDRQFGSTDEVLFRGRLSGHVLRGRIRVRDRLGKHRCSSPWVKFTAHR